mmetsp:Transcript_33452/g.70118  ORF Transcript_33452/g.70118 Transcript_33452/m.70118 type:complete len:232 (-) Transcript_33452:347-1042(-)
MPEQQDWFQVHLQGPQLVKQRPHLSCVEVLHSKSLYAELQLTNVVFDSQQPCQLGVNAKVDHDCPEPACQRLLETRQHAVPDPPDPRAGGAQQQEAQARHEVRQRHKHDPRAAHVQQPRRIPIVARERLGHRPLQRLQAQEPLPRHGALVAICWTAALRRLSRRDWHRLLAVTGAEKIRLCCSSLGTIAPRHPAPALAHCCLLGVRDLFVQSPARLVPARNQTGGGQLLGN